LALEPGTDIVLPTGYIEDRPAQSVSFGYSQDNANQYLTNRNYVFLEANWRFAWEMSLISTNQTTYKSYS